VLAVLDGLRVAYASHHRPRASLRDAVPLVRRAIEQHTFALMPTDAGVRLADATTARYARAADVTLVGLIEGEWPLPARRSILYPGGLLRDLGIPSESERQAFSRAAFLDLAGLAVERCTLSTFQLEEDAIVRPSTLLDEIGEAGLSHLPARDEAGEGDAASAVDPIASSWTNLRGRRTAPADEAFHGFVGPTLPGTVSVTQIERYLECPFKFFASVLLQLDEDDEAAEPVGLDPRRRGTIVHRVFQDFFDAWSRQGHGAISAAVMPVARVLFEETVDACLADLSEADRVLERARLVGSATAIGLGERVFRLEARHPTPIVERLLEFNLRGEYELGDEGHRLVLKGVADRIDLLSDGSLRLIDYKTGRPPDPRRSVQLALYALCAEHKLAGYRGRTWRVSEAAYLALADRRPWVRVIEHVQDREPILRAATAALGAVADMSAGRFPPSPADRRSCSFCAYAAVCRKDYVGDAA
jgi:RecB family exonuclease